jgi:hypothetical protein
MRRLKIAAVAAAGITGALVPFQIAGAGTVVQSAMAKTYFTHPNDIEISFQVRQDAGPRAIALNTAFAESDGCTGCRTIALSIEVDLVSGTTSAVAASNRAISLDRGTTNSQTLADALQFVVATGGTNVSLSATGTAALNAIVQSLTNEAYSSTPVTQLNSDINAAIPSIQQILTTDVVSTYPTESPTVAEGGQSSIGT